MVRKMLLLFFMVPGDYAPRAKSWSPHQTQLWVASKTSKPLEPIRRTEWGEQMSSPRGSNSRIPAISFSRFPGSKTSSQIYWESSQPRSFPGAQRTWCTSFLKIPGSGAACTMLTLNITRNLALGKQVKAAYVEHGMSQAGRSDRCSWQRWPSFSQFPDLPLSWHQPCSKFLKLSPFFSIEQLQDDYFCFLSWDGAQPNLFLFSFPTRMERMGWKRPDDKSKKIKWFRSSWEGGARKAKEGKARSSLMI